MPRYSLSSKTYSWSFTTQNRLQKLCTAKQKINKSINIFLTTGDGSGFSKCFFPLLMGVSQSRVQHFASYTKSWLKLLRMQHKCTAWYLNIKCVRTKLHYSHLSFSYKNIPKSVIRHDDSLYDISDLGFV